MVCFAHIMPPTRNQSAKVGHPPTLSGYEIQTEKYSVGLPPELKPARKALPFCYQSTGIETRFTNLIEPDARSRPVLIFPSPRNVRGMARARSKVSAATRREGSSATSFCDLATKAMRPRIYGVIFCMPSEKSS
jgi:type I site-specific restriction endonuclease